MEFVDEIGLEQEVWLLDKNGKIMEPAIFSFPHDDFGFLIELRTRPYTKPKPVLEDLQKLWDGFSNLAHWFDLELVCRDSMPIDKPLIDYLRVKYNYFNLHDLTENVETGTYKTHATGISEDAEKLTAGLHVHFSRKTPDGRRVQLPIYQIVQCMDGVFAKEIQDAGRIPGEYEVKSYGFEFRSLPATVNPEKVVKNAFNFLEQF
jgi:hypothetical protein